MSSQDYKFSDLNKKEQGRKFAKEIRTVVLAAFTFVASLQINEALKKTLDSVTPERYKTTLWNQWLAAVIIIFIVICLAIFMPNPFI